jgi:CheY-like chemotaxis protein
MPRILLIDDDESFRKMLRLTLAHLGHTVSEVGNGREGVHVQSVEPADVVFTDIIMPDQEGLETIIALRRTQPDVRIVAMSGGGRVDARDYLSMAQRLGARCVLEKPFSNAALQHAITTALR